MTVPVVERLGQNVVDFNNLSKGFGDNLLIDDLSFKLPPGGIVGVIGPNGAGKTTLFRMKLGLSAKELEKLLLEEAKVALNQGYIFGKTGEGFARLNVACPRKTLEEGLHRIKEAVQALENK